MRLHERTIPVQKAANQIAMALIELQEEHDLTDIEMLQILSNRQLDILRYMLRDERHPGKPDARADEEEEEEEEDDDA